MKSSKTVEKKLDRLASELGTTIKGMTAEEKLEYARTDTVKAKKEQKSAKFERFPKRKLKATNKELKRTIRLMVDRVQKRVTVEPFNAICWRASDDSITSDFLFWGDTPLDPQAPVDYARFHDIINRLRKSVTAKDKEADGMLLALSDLSYDLCFYSEQVSSYMGVLIGFDDGRYTRQAEDHRPRDL